MTDLIAEAKRLVELGERSVSGPWRLRRRDGVASGNSSILGWDWDWNCTTNPPEPMRGVFEFEADARLAEAGRNIAPTIAKAYLDALDLLRGFLDCPEIADCAPDDKDPVTTELERKARAVVGARHDR